MKTNTQNKTTQNSFSRIGFVVLVLFLLSSVGMVGQNVQPTVATSTTTFTVASSDEVVATAQTTTTTNTTMNFVSWFMGTKQTPSNNQSGEFSTNSKKQIIQSGIAPNRLLIKAFLKKATNYNSTIA
jgi:hypothetical protein